MSMHGSIIHGKGAAVLAVFLMASCTSGSSDPAPTGTGPTDPTASDVRVLNDCPALPCQGLLEPGDYRWEYRSTPNEPAIAFTVTSPGWTWYYSGGFRIVADHSPTIEGLYIADGIYFLHDPAIASQDCEESVLPGVGRSVDELVGWLEAAPGLAVTEPSPVKVGGLDGMRLDIRIDPAWKRTCSFSEKMPVVQLIFSGAKLGGYLWAIVPGQSMRWYILGSDDGTLIVALEDDPGGLPHGELLRTGSEIVESLEFSPA